MFKRADRSESDAQLRERPLLVRHREGDPSAFPELLSSYGPRVRGYVIRAVGDQSVHDDLFQEIFVKVHRAAETYQAERPFEPWLFAIAANTVRSYFRRRKVSDRLAGKSGAEEEGTECDVEAQVSASQTLRWLTIELEKLSFAERQVILLCCVQELELKHAAESLNMPLNTVKTHLRRARVKLASALLSRESKDPSEVLP